MEGLSDRLSPRALIWVAACLILEYLLISVLVDARYLEQRLRWLSGIGYVGPLLIAMGTATLLFKGDLLTPAPHAGITKRPPSRRWLRWRC